MTLYAISRWSRNYFPGRQWMNTKIVLAMKLTVFLTLVVTLNASARGYSQQVTLSEKNMPLEKVFKRIKAQTGYAFFYAESLLDIAHPVTIDVKNVPLVSALDICFEGQPLTFSIIGNNVVVKKKPGIAEVAEANIPVAGKVVDENGNPMEGITVTVKGTSMATATGSDGTFTLHNVDPDAVLVFTGVNIETREVRIKGKQQLGDVSVKIRILSQEEITVNTGYQSISRERSSGSFSKPDVQLMKNRSSSMNILQRLDGLVPGLTVNNAPGAEPLLLRGLTSINATRAPLVVVDGVPIEDISTVNPQDVADITVLKDATAASIWGAKASNGVIVIVTKKGMPNGKLNVSYDGFVNFQGYPDLGYMPVMNSKEYIQTAKEMFDPVAYRWSSVSSGRGVGVPPHEMILYNLSRGLITQAQADKSLDSLANTNNFEQIRDLWYRPASLTNHTISVNTGGKIYSLYGSLSYTGTHSNRPGESDNSFKANFRQDFKFSDRIKLYLITDLTNRITDAPNNIPVDYRFYPYQLFEDANGNHLNMAYLGDYSDSVRKVASAKSRISYDYVPLDEVGLGNTKTKNLFNRIVGGASIGLFKGLRFEGTYGYNAGNNHYANYIDNKAFRQRMELIDFTVAPSPASMPVYYLPVAGGKYTVTDVIERDWTVRNQLIYDKSWQNKHKLTLLVGQEAQEQWTNSTTLVTLGYDPQLLTHASVDYALLMEGVEGTVTKNSYGGSTRSDDSFDQSEVQDRFTSYYANGAYTYNNKYTLNGSWRIDKSNLFGLDKSAQNRPVWSAGIKWLAGNEDFMKSLTFLNRLDLRATYGVTGNSPLPGTASSYDVLSPQSNFFFPGGVGLSVATAANPKLTWENTNTINLGLDWSIWNDRLSGSIDYYDKKTQNLIGQMPVNILTGYTSIIGNFGSLQNHGIEISLHSLNVRTRDFTWSTLLNLAVNRNKITELKYETPITTGLDKIYTNFFGGYPAYAVFAYQYAGLDSLGDPRIYLDDKTITKQPDAARADDVRYMGTSQPPWSGGFFNQFTYKGFSLGVNISFNFGAVTRRDVPYRLILNRLVGTSLYYTGTGSFKSANPNRLFLDRWKKPGDEKFTNIPSYVANNSVSMNRRDLSYYYFADFNVIDASYAKVRDITLSYTLPYSILKRLHTQEITLRTQVSNIMLWKANKVGIDPEFQGAYGSRNMRMNQGTFTVGAHVSF